MARHSSIARKFLYRASLTNWASLLQHIIRNSKLNAPNAFRTIEGCRLRLETPLLTGTLQLMFNNTALVMSLLELSYQVSNLSWILLVTRLICRILLHLITNHPLTFLIAWNTAIVIHYNMKSVKEFKKRKFTCGKFKKVVYTVTTVL